MNRGALSVERIVEFTLPSRQTSIRCAGRVAWVNQPVLLDKPELAAGMGSSSSTCDSPI